MEFHIVSSSKNIPHGSTDAFYLISDNWDDWFKYSTQFFVYYVNKAGELAPIGNIKIGQAGQTRSPNVPNSFNTLSEDFFSVGQDVSYYENLKRVVPDVIADVLSSLRDMAFDTSIFKRFKGESVMDASLLRYVSETKLLGQLSRSARGGADLTEFHFSYTYPKYFITKKTQEKFEIADPVSLKFDVTPNSLPPTNVHVIIGRNAVGKTVLLNNMVRSLVDKRTLRTEVGKFEGHSDIPVGIFANVVSMSFSAFDENPPIADWNLRDGVKYSYIGLKQPPEKGKSHSKSKSPSELTNEFVNSVKNCRGEPLRQRWVRAIATLESDPIFKESEFIRLLNIRDSQRFEEYAIGMFDRLSSGHKIVLLGITRLVEVVEEKSLVIMDEPEIHLHPPLLAAFVRTLSELLVNRNGVAVVATHSPVVLQEVPKSCVWQLQRSQLIVNANRPERETFGENVGVLTSDVFGLEVVQTGFHTILNKCIEENDTYEEVLESLNGELGFEGKVILRSLIAQRKKTA